jgi:hypothetical protein
MRTISNGGNSKYAGVGTPRPNVLPVFCTQTGVAAAQVASALTREHGENV